MDNKMAKQVPSVNLVRMNNGAHFEFASTVLASVQSSLMAEPQLEGYIMAFAEALDVEDEALKISAKSLITDDIAKADDDRGVLYIGYKRAVKGFRNMTDASMAQAAKVLNQHIKDYGIQVKAQIDQKTGLLANFIADLEGKYAVYVTTLGLTVFVTHLKEANERVRSLIRQRVNERMGITVGALKTARANTDVAYHNLVNMVNALALVKGDTAYASFIDYVNAEITRYKREVLNQKAAAADTSADSADTTDTESTDSSSDSGTSGSDSSSGSSDSGTQSGGSSSETGGSSTQPGDGQTSGED